MRRAVDPDTALGLVVDCSRELEPVEVALAEASDAVLAEPLVADRDYPPFDRAAMDGFAVRLADAGRRVPVAGELAAGAVWQGELADGRVIEIMTGAPCPPGTQAVVPREETTRSGPDVQLPAAVGPGQHVAAAGSECRAGAEVLPAGAVLTPLAVAVAASFGRMRVRVVPRPRVSVVVTGDEIVPPGGEPGPAQIRDSNGAMLAAMVRAARARVDAVRFAGDTAEELRAALAASAASDVVLLTGGVSAGKYDLVPELLHELGAEIVFHKVTQKPGKPLLFARGPRQLVFGLPGNPLSAHLGFSRYVRAALARMARRPLPPAEIATLSRPLELRGDRTSFVLARAERRPEGLVVAPLLGRGSADIFASAAANAYLRLEPGAQALPAGSRVAVTWA